MPAALACLAATALAVATDPPAEPPQTGQPAAIRWMDWSDAAFERAAAEGKPIMLHVRVPWSRPSIWSEEKIFTDPEIVALANERWVAIRVDRDRRPDIDARYQIAVNAVVRGEAGWPLTALLFGNGEIIYGGSFITAQDRPNRPGMKSLLVSTAELYEKNKESASGTVKIVQMAFEREGQVVRPATISAAIVNEMTDTLVDTLDREFGGFGPPPRVLTPYAIDLATTVYHRTRSQVILDVVVRTLEGMERGALHDRVGGGFHRTVEDAAWRQPEYEKLIHYNAPLMIDYLHAYEATGDEGFRDVAAGTLDYILGTLTDPAGGFYLGQWAATSAEEPRGLYYSWSDDEFRTLIPPERVRLARTLFHVTPEGDFSLGPPPRQLLYVTLSRKEAAQRLEMTEEEVRRGEAAILQALRSARSRRTPPPVEKAIYIDSSASAALALLEAHRVLGRQDAFDAAIRSLDRMLGAVPSSGPLRHRLEPPPDPAQDPVLAQDHMMLAQAALAAYEATGEPRYLAGARDLTDRAIALFWDAAAGGFFDLPPDTGARGYLAIRRRLKNDTAFPALNAGAARVLDRLSLHTRDASYRSRAESALKVLISVTKKLDHLHGSLGLAVESFLNPPTRYVVIGDRSAPAVREMLAVARSRFDPGRAIVYLTPGVDDEEITRLGGRKAKDRCVLVCRGQKCSAPVKDAATLKAVLDAPAR